MNGAPALPWPASVLATRTPVDDGRMPHPGVRGSTAGTAGDLDAQVARFTAACESVGGHVHHLSTLPDIVALVRHVCEGHASASVLAWDEEHLPLPGVLGALSRDGLTVVDGTVRLDDIGHAQDLRQMEVAAVGVTGATTLLADTGSVVVASGAGRPRLASLLPPVHVALVRRDQLVPSLGTWMADDPGRVRAWANCVAITGPSRTADIEMTLTRGVHGPRAVHVVFVS